MLPIPLRDGFTFSLSYIAVPLIKSSLHKISYLMFGSSIFDSY